MLKLNAAAVLILSAVVATSAVAAGRQDEPFDSVSGELTAEKSTVTRAQVKAEVLRARAAGELDKTESSYPFVQPQEQAHVTRAEVLAEAIRARNAGELDSNEATPY